jgi:multiple sugar transport system ATP-binding protein
MGRCIVRDPQVFLFDEPLSNLDAKLRVQMRTEIKELHQRLKTTSVYVTHDQIEAMTMADKIVVMRDGRRADRLAAGAVRPPRQPVRRRLHRLAGHELPARRAAARNGGARVEFGGGLSLPAPPRRRGAGRPAGRLRHPPRAHAAGHGDEGVPTEVVVVEPTGADTQVFTKIAGVEVTSVFRDRHAFRPARSSGCAPTRRAPTCSTPPAACGWP